MFKKLTAIAAQLKTLWGFLALFVGLGITWGTVTSKLDDACKELAETKHELKQTERALRRTIESRFDRAHDLLERRLEQNDRALASLHESITQLAWLAARAQDVRRPTPAAVKRSVGGAQAALKQATVEHEYLGAMQTLGDLPDAPAPPPTPLPAF